MSVGHHDEGDPLERANYRLSITIMELSWGQSQRCAMYGRTVVDD